MSARDVALKFEELERVIPYPEKPGKPSRENCNSNAEYGGLLDNYESQLVSFRAAVISHRNKLQQLNMEFKAALAKEFNLVNHPKLDKLFELAWEHGHSAGYTEVAMYFEEFAELLGG